LLDSSNNNNNIAVESLGPMNIAAYSFLALAELGRKILDVSGDNRESSYLFQQISVLIQRYKLQQRYLAARELY